MKIREQRKKQELIPTTEGKGQTELLFLGPVCQAQCQLSSLHLRIQSVMIQVSISKMGPKSKVWL